jgi:structural maintenance of chromosome 1
MFENQRIEETRARLTKLEFKKESLTGLHSKATVTANELISRNDELTDQMTEISQSIEEWNSTVESSGQQLQKAKKAAQDFQKNYDNNLDTLGVNDSQLSKLKVERKAILRKCRLEEIEIPLENGKRLSSVPMEYFNVTASHVGEDK